MSDPLDLISVYEGANVTEAHIVKNLLLEEDIAAYVSEQNEPLAGLTIVPPDVLVSRADEARAREIVDRYQERQLERASEPDEDEDEDDFDEDFDDDYEEEEEGEEKDAE